MKILIEKNINNNYKIIEFTQDDGILIRNLEYDSITICRGIKDGFASDWLGKFDYCYYIKSLNNNNDICSFIICRTDLENNNNIEILLLCTGENYPGFGRILMKKVIDKCINDNKIACILSSVNDEKEFEFYHSFNFKDIKYNHDDCLDMILIL